MVNKIKIATFQLNKKKKEFQELVQDYESKSYINTSVKTQLAANDFGGGWMRERMTSCSEL